MYFSLFLFLLLLLTSSERVDLHQFNQFNPACLLPHFITEQFFSGCICFCLQLFNWDCFAEKIHSNPETRKQRCMTFICAFFYASIVAAHSIATNHLMILSVKLLCFFFKMYFAEEDVHTDKIIRFYMDKEPEDLMSVRDFLQN